MHGVFSLFYGFTHYDEGPDNNSMYENLTKSLYFRHFFLQVTIYQDGDRQREGRRNKSLSPSSTRLR